MQEDRDTKTKAISDFCRQRSIEYINLVTGGDLQSNLALLQLFPQQSTVEGEDLHIGFSDSPLARNYLETLVFHIAADHDSKMCYQYQKNYPIPNKISFGSWLSKEEVLHYAFLLSDSMIMGLLRQTAELIRDLMADTPPDADHVNWDYRRSCYEEPLDIFLENFNVRFAYPY